MTLLESLKENPFLLAPMAGITNNAFRSFMKDMGAGILTTELISANGIEYASQRTLDLMKFEKSQSPVGIQLFGETPEVVARGAQLCEEYGADFVDLNFGCPVPKVVKKGAGSAILKDPKRVQDMFRVVKAAISIPLTVKIRTGWDAEHRNASEVAQIAYDEGLSWVAIHGRTRAQAYTGKADWDFIGEVKAQSQIPIIGNGDIHSAEAANERLSAYNLDGVMIGRGCLKNPLIFQESLGLFRGESQGQRAIDFVWLFEKLRDYLERYERERVVGIQLKKFAAWFSAGYPGSSSFRKTLFQLKTVDEVAHCVMNYFEPLGMSSRTDTSDEPFLMGGHG